MKRSLIVFFILSFLCAPLSAQDYYFRNYQVENGLSHNTITSMLQDQRGFLWFGTKDGLNRFDGYSFKVFQNSEAMHNGLGSNFIRSLHEYKNSIWVGTDNGLYRYNEENEDFELVRTTLDKPIFDIMDDAAGHLWFVAAGTIYSYNVASQKIDSPSVQKNVVIEYLVKTNNGAVLAASQSEVYLYDPTKNHFDSLDLNLDNLKPLLITSLFSLDSSTLLLGTKYQGVISYSLTQQKGMQLMPDLQEPLYVRDLALKGTSELWIATESGLFIYDLEKGTAINLKKSYNDRFALSDNAIYSIVVDREQGVWLGTYFGGVNYYSKPFTPFKKYFPKVGENSISGNAVREIQQDQYGNLWIGTEDAGLNKFDPKTGKFTNYNIPLLSHYNIHGLLARGDELWIGTFEHGLDVMDIKTGKILRHYGRSNPSDGLDSDFVLDVYETQDTRLYLATSAGVYRFRESDNHFDLVKGFPEKYHYSYLIEDQEGTLWAGTYWDGLAYYNPKTGATGIYTYNRKESKSISSNIINGIYTDAFNTLWITTENGLNKFNSGTRDFEHIGIKEGLPSNVVYSVLEGGKDNLWLSTSGGLANYDLTDKTVEVYTRANGLLNDQFNYSSAFKDGNGRLYFGSVYGMISFNPADFSKNTYKAPILFTGFKIDNDEVPVNDERSPLDKSISFLKQITLKDKQSSFSLEFATLSYAAPEMTDYWYQMKGLSDAWIPLKKNHRVYFTELPAGDYSFTVKSRNSHGVWSVQESGLDIEVLPPFYLSTLAYLVYFVLALSLIVFGLNYYHNYNRAKNDQKINQLNNEKEKEIYQAKIEFFTNVAHEIRTPLTLIKSPLDKLINTPPPSMDGVQHTLSIMHKNTSRLLSLVNQLLDFRKTEIKNMQLSFVEANIGKLLKENHARFGPAIQEKGLDVSLKLPSTALHAYVDEEAMRKIMSNLYSNAIKYSLYEVQVSLELVEDAFKVTVKNDGARIPESLAHKIFEPFFRISESENQTGSGIGLSLAHSLAHLHNGSLTLNASEKNLNSFCLSLPLHQDQEFELYPAKAEDEILETQHNPTAKPSKTAKPNVLLVEDNKDLLDFIATELAGSYHLLKAANGQEALDLIATQSIQLIISDVMMPVMDGVQLCKTIKTKIEYSHIPVILLTAKGALHSKIEGLESGADAYIPKPFDINYLRAQAQTLLDNRKHVMEYYASTPLSYIKTIAHSSTDADFLSALDAAILAHLPDQNLNVDVLAEIMNMSRSTLYRKIKDLSEMTPNELINITRLKSAAELLATGDYKVFEVAQKVGFRSQTSFGRSFQKQFEMTPSEFMGSREE